MTAIARRSDVLGAVLAGGAARRIGGDKATVLLGGRPLLLYPLDAVREALDEVVVVAKRDTALPDLDPAVHVWVEPPLPRHPLTGIVHALRLAGGRPVFVCATDMPLLDATAIRTVLDADPRGAAVVAARVDARLQPCCALYRPHALTALAGFDPDAAATVLIEEIGVEPVDLPDPLACFNVNTPDDLLQASALLAR